jgi:hypothetical protein
MSPKINVSARPPSFRYTTRYSASDKNRRRSRGSIFRDFAYAANPLGVYLEIRELHVNILSATPTDSHLPTHGDSPEWRMPAKMKQRLLSAN